MYYIMSIPEILVLLFILSLWVLSIVCCFKRYEKISTIERADMPTFNKQNINNTTSSSSLNKNINNTINNNNNNNMNNNNNNTNNSMNTLNNINTNQIVSGSQLNANLMSSIDNSNNFHYSLINLNTNDTNTSLNATMGTTNNNNNNGSLFNNRNYSCNFNNKNGSMSFENYCINKKSNSEHQHQQQQQQQQPTVKLKNNYLLLRQNALSYAPVNSKNIIVVDETASAVAATAATTITTTSTSTASAAATTSTSNNRNTNRHQHYRYELISNEKLRLNNHQYNPKYQSNRTTSSHNSFASQRLINNSINYAQLSQPTNQSVNYYNPNQLQIFNSNSNSNSNTNRKYFHLSSPQQHYSCDTNLIYTNNNHNYHINHLNNKNSTAAASSLSAANRYRLPNKYSSSLINKKPTSQTFLNINSINNYNHNKSNSQIGNTFLKSSSEPAFQELVDKTSFSLVQISADEDEPLLRTISIDDNTAVNTSYDPNLNLDENIFFKRSKSQTNYSNSNLNTAIKTSPGGIGVAAVASVAAMPINSNNNKLRNDSNLLNPQLIPKVIRKSLIDLHKKSVWNLSHKTSNPTQSSNSNNSHSYGHNHSHSHSHNHQSNINNLTFNNNNNKMNDNSLNSMIITSTNNGNVINSTNIAMNNSTSLNATYLNATVVTQQRHRNEIRMKIIENYI